MSLQLVKKETLDELTKKAGAKTTVLATSVARLYVSADGQWKYTSIFGLIAYVMDRETKVQFIRIHNMKDLSIRFQVEVPFEPVYIAESEYFHSLELDNQVIGFLFALSREEKLPQDKSTTLTSEARRFANKVTSYSLKDQDLKEAKENAKSIGADGPKRRGSAWNTLKSAAKGMLGISSEPAVVGTPQNFQHLHHVGLKPDGTMDIGSIPEAWKDILKTAGVTKKDMNNPQINKMVVNTLGQLIPPSSAPFDNKAPKESTSQQTVKPMMVKFDFSKSSQKEVSVSEGELVTLTRKFNDGWARVQKKDGQSGMVPFNYLGEISGGSNEGSEIPIMPQPRVDSGGAAAPTASPMPPVKKTPPTPAAPRPASAAAPPPPRPGPPVAAAAAAATSESPVRVPPRPTPPRPTAVSAKKVQAPPVPAAAAAVEAQDSQYGEEDATERGSEEPMEDETLKPPKNPLLAGIQGFNKNALKSNASDEDSSEDRPSRPPVNPLLASIQGFSADKLQRVDSATLKPAAAATPNPLDAIKSGAFNLKKVDKPERPAEPPKAASTPEMEGIAGLLKAKLANIRLGVKEEEDDDDAGSDWD